MAPDRPAVRVTHLTKRFGHTKALDDVTLDIPQGSLYGMLGPNGAGKTTLFSVAAGFLKPTKGSIEVLGIDIEEVSRLQGRLSILPQDALFESNVPIIEQLIFFGRLMDYSRSESLDLAHRALEKVGLGESARKNARTLSHGMTKRLGITQAFLGDPDVVFLDEPTAGLDPGNARDVRKLIGRLHEESVTVIISSHNLQEIQDICTHFAILDKGLLLEEGSMADFVQADTIVRITFPRDLNAEEVKQVNTVPGVKGLTSESRGEYTISLDYSALAEESRHVTQVAGGSADVARGSTDIATEPGRAPVPSPNKTQQEAIVSQILQRLLPSGLVPRAVNYGASLESRFLEITSGLDLEG